jgi:hypothetical protein
MYQLARRLGLFASPRVHKRQPRDAPFFLIQNDHVWLSYCIFTTIV